jgi:glycosyltransferase involved in cell wall biosynthesis
MQYTPLVSVIIPIYNRSNTIEQAVDSVLSQQYTNYEIILIDDGSTDNTKEILSKYISNYNNIVYVYQNNSGPSAARNTGIMKAKGELIAFLDSDDVWRCDKLERQIPCFRNNPRIGLVASGHEVLDEDRNVKYVTLLNEKEIRQLNRKDLYKNFFSTPSVIVRADCFNNMGLFDNTVRYAEDWDMWLRILTCYDCEIIQEPLVSIRVHRTSITNEYSDAKFEDWYKVIKKHYNDDNTKTMTKQKRLSWLFLNQAYQYREIGKKNYKIYIIKSIIAWPLWYLGRYYSLFRS